MRPGVVRCRRTARLRWRHQAGSGGSGARGEGGEELPRYNVRSKASSTPCSNAAFSGTVSCGCAAAIAAATSCWPSAAGAAGSAPRVGRGALGRLWRNLVTHVIQHVPVRHSAPRWAWRACCGSCPCSPLPSLGKPCAGSVALGERAEAGCKHRPAATGLGPAQVTGRPVTACNCRLARPARSPASLYAPQPKACRAAWLPNKS